MGEVVMSHRSWVILAGCLAFITIAAALYVIGV
jgi:hypothetical protein